MAGSVPVRNSYRIYRYIQVYNVRDTEHVTQFALSVTVQ